MAQGPPLQSSVNQSFHASQNYLSPINMNNVKWTNAENKPLVKLVQDQVLQSPNNGWKPTVGIPETLPNSNMSSYIGKQKNSKHIVVESQRS